MYPRRRYEACAGVAGVASGWRGDRVKPNEALAFVRRHGVVVQAARGPVPSVAEKIAGGPIRGSWWGHPKGREIFRAAQAICASPEVLVCKLVDGKVTYVHRRLWPALVKLASRFRKAQLAKVRDEHTPSGTHRSRREAFPSWVPADVMREGKALSVAEAESVLAPWLALGRKRTADVARRVPDSVRVILRQGGHDGKE